MFMTFGIVNDDTASVIIPRALEAAGVDEVQPWPGTEFVVGEGGEEKEEAALALIGSPNGLGAGYFLLQHKRQLGGAKFIGKIRVLKGDDDFESEDPNIIFYVNGNAPPMGNERLSSFKLRESENESRGLRIAEVKRNDSWSAPRVVKRSENGKALIREHMLMAKS
ncbi:hypothetical protein NX059_009826 [Plenodomus lindquistii]|nr:hypothetical protein NX059_009826 [Plenodomus lindquistii]